MPTRQSTDKAVDAFVSRVNTLPRPRRPGDEVPVLLRVGNPDADDLYVWLIRAVPAAPWIDALEQHLPRPLPPSFRSLVTRYAFPSLEIRAAHVFANTGDTATDEELTVRTFADHFLSRLLLQNGYVQIGWRTAMFYDPVCFDMSARSKGGEYAIVGLDHEAALTKEKVRIVERIAPSFLDLLECRSDSR